MICGTLSVQGRGRRKAAEGKMDGQSFHVLFEMELG